MANIKHRSIIAANACSWEKVACIPMTLAFRYVREKVPDIERRIQDLSTIVASQILADGGKRADLERMNTQVFQLVKPYAGVDRLQESAVEAEHSEKSKSQEEADFERAYKYVLEMRQDAPLYSPKTLVSNPRKRGTKDRNSELTAMDLRGAQVKKRQRTENDGKLFKPFLSCVQGGISN
jgi:hypothetical protein